MTRRHGVPLRIASMSTSVASFESAILLFSGVANGDTNIHDPIPEAAPHVSTYVVCCMRMGESLYKVRARFPPLDLAYMAVFI